MKHRTHCLYRSFMRAAASCRESRRKQACAFQITAVLMVFAAAAVAQGKDVPMTRPEACIAVFNGIAHHASFIERLDGSILMVWGGIQHPTLWAVSSDGGQSWSKGSEMRDAGGELLGGHDTHSLIRLAGGAIGYLNRTRIGSGTHEYLRFWRSDDDGKTWRKPVRIGPPVDHEVTCIHDGFIRTKSGRIILPVYGRMELPPDPVEPRPEIGGFLRNQWIRIAVHEYDPRFSWSYVFYSDDDGETWKSSRSGGLMVWDPDRMSWHRTSQPSVAELAPGKLLMLLRTDLGRHFQSWSTDNGETWTLPKPTDLAAPAFPAQIRRIPGTGDLLAVWTQAGPEEIRRGLGRGRLSSAISRVHGAQGNLWEFYQNVDSILEGTRMEPGPIQSARPTGLFYGQGRGSPVREPELMGNLPDNYATMACPSVFFYKDRVFIAQAREGNYREDGSYDFGQLKVLPISWLYGGEANMKPNRFLDELKRRFPTR